MDFIDPKKLLTYQIPQDVLLKEALRTLRLAIIRWVEISKTRSFR